MDVWHRWTNGQKNRWKENGWKGNSLWNQKDMNFSTHDHDRDRHSGNCASMFKAGSWYNACHSTNLNGLYLGGLNEQYAIGMTWSSWRGQKYSLKSTQMKIAANQ
ncbi:hypothetical protein AB205_0049110 [Aquarana catesbeiana]|uniref:Fibrinogen C-terminal domain-containing protein n=1 Tax=Aquarana catesbeiana TaxID=8400 RepID=A0A2G9RY38_AQUCT|nr:hypothetical protein AB205_0049110 [Aquarana catesbeiana]